MPRPQPTDLLLYEAPQYPWHAAREKHFESRAEALSFARHIATLYGAPFVAELFPAEAGAEFSDVPCDPYEIRRIRPSKKR